MKLIISMLLFVLVANSEGWNQDFAAAKKEATSQQKFILLNFSGSDWCGPCIKLKKDVFETDVFQTFASKKLVLVRADFPRQKKNKLSKEQELHNEQLAEIYNQEGAFPLTILMDANGKVIKQWEGYQSSKEVFISELETFTK